MINLSVLMSIYNEPLSFIKESVDSILAQTYKNFEFVIIVDNPLRKDEISSFFNTNYQDERICLFYNSSNIGLALSMNRAAILSKGIIFARMDADDIAEHNRFEEELPYIESGEYDFVFSRYSYMDEDSVFLKRQEQIFYDNDGLGKRISLNPSIVHHPTVMFTREIFEKVGGYRNFPCSQDADLWLRLSESRCRFIMLEQKLLRYRINSNSISVKKWLQQQLTIFYIMELSLKRIKCGTDDFSESGYQKYLVDKGLQKPRVQRNMERSEKQLMVANSYGNKGYIFIRFFIKLHVFFTSKLRRHNYLVIMNKKHLLNRN